MTSNRRDVLELVGVTATIATAGAAVPGIATARAVVDDDHPSDELPTYGRWLTLDDGWVDFAYVDWTTLETYVEDELEEAGAAEDTEVPPELEADPMIAIPSDGLLGLYLSAGFELAQYGLGGVLDADEFESSVEKLLRVNDALVVAGSMEPEEIGDRLTAEPEATFVTQLERTDEIAGYDVFTPVEDDVDEAVAVASDAIVIGGGEDGEQAATRAILERTIAAAGGDDRATDESEPVRWLVATAGHGDVAVGQYNDPAADEPAARPDEDRGLVDPAFEELTDADGLVASLTVEDESTSTGSFAAIVDEPDAELEALLGASADERSVEIDDDRVTATATWRELD